MSWSEVKYAVNSTLGSEGFLPLNELILMQALSDKNTWYYSTLQCGFPKLLGLYCNLQNVNLLKMNTYMEILTDTDVLLEIGSNELATAICATNPELRSALNLILSPNQILSYKLAYLFYQEGDEFVLSMKDGTTQTFRVVAVNSDANDTITCRNTNTWTKTIRVPSYSDYSPYGSSELRNTVNSWLSLFPDDIGSNMVPISKKYGMIVSSTGISYGEVNDKLWLYAGSEIGLTAGSSSSTYSAPDEGSAYSSAGLGKLNFYNEASEILPQSVLRSIQRYNGDGQTYRLGVRWYSNKLSLDTCNQDKNFKPFFGFVI